MTLLQENLKTSSPLIYISLTTPKQKLLQSSPVIRRITLIHFIFDFIIRKTPPRLFCFYPQLNNENNSYFLIMGKAEAKFLSSIFIINGGSCLGSSIPLLLHLTSRENLSKFSSSFSSMTRFFPFI